jgi:hypothetical protein
VIVNVVDFIFGRRPTERDVIDEPPAGVIWREVRPKPSPPVRARRAESDCHVETGQGVLKARGGKDYIIDYGGGDRAVIRGDIFERTYKRVAEGQYAKRTDIVLRYFELDRPAIVETLEGPQRGEPGDWVMQGVAGELWPVPRDKALSKYQPV